MARVYVKVEGLNEVIEGFKRMGEDGKKVLHEAVNIGAEMLAPQIRANTPVGTEDDQHLKNNIKAKKAKPKKTLKQTAEIVVGAKNTDYAFHVETGHRTKSGRTVPANPFVRRTVDGVSEAVAEKVVTHILDRIGV